MIQHMLGCEHPLVRVTRGLTKDLYHCPGCGAEAWVTKR